MAYLYPWGNTQQLNLDWILQKIKDIEAGTGGVNLDEVSNALLAASYAAQAYTRSDIVFHDGKLYRANQDIPAPGEAWTPAHWDEILLGDTVSNLVQYVAALSNDQIANSSSVSGTHTSDALDNLKGAIDGLQDIVGDGSLTGFTATDLTGAANELNGAINDVQGQISAYVENGNTSSRAYAVGEYLVWKGDFYRVKTAITSSGVTFTPNTNIVATSIGAEIASSATSSVTLDTTNTTAGTFNLSRCGNILIIDGYIALNGNVAGNDKTLVTFPTGFRPTTHRYFRVYATYNGNVGFYQMRLNTDGTLITSTGGSVFSGQVIFPSVTILI